jgi:hypothetical protein
MMWLSDHEPFKDGDRSPHPPNLPQTQSSRPYIIIKSSHLSVLNLLTQEVYTSSVLLQRLDHHHYHYDNPRNDDSSIG